MSALGNYTGSAFNQFGNTSLFGQNAAGGYSAPTNLPPSSSNPAAQPPAQPAAQPTQSAVATPTPTASSPWASFQPTYQQNGWNPQEYATDSTANQLAGLLGGNVVKTNQGSMNNFGVPAQNNIDLGAQDTFNAGLLAQRYSSNLMPQWQKDAMTQAELARSGPYSGSASDATNLVDRSKTPTVAPIAQQAFDSLKTNPVAAAQAATPGLSGTPAPKPAQTTQQQQDQFFGGSQNNPANSTNTNFLSQLQSIMPLLQLLGGFQGTSLQAAQTVPSSVQQTPYGYTQWTQGIKPTGSYSGYQGTYNGSQTAPGSSNTGSNASLTQLLQLLTGNSNRGQGSGALF